MLVTSILHLRKSILTRSYDLIRSTIDLIIMSFLVGKKHKFEVVCLNSEYPYSRAENHTSPWTQTLEVNINMIDNRYYVKSKNPGHCSTFASSAMGTFSCGLNK